MKNEMNERDMLGVMGGRPDITFGDPVPEGNRLMSATPLIIGGSLKGSPFTWLPHYAGPPVLHPPIKIDDPVPVPTFAS
jgi:hypothetical protein